MSIIHLGGVDPGLVHTGLVSIRADSQKRTCTVLTEIIDGPDVERVQSLSSVVLKGAQIFVEKYEDRGTVFSTHSDMRVFETKVMAALPHAKLLSNTGVKKVITDQMLDAIVGDLPTTNHKDLESAARIAIAGGLKDPQINSVMYHLLLDHLRGESWQRV
ncbi:hypothetical protein SEA_GSHELBY23_8 [Microbacterium phage Gshelby23]|nr:hypothetical protein SEA_GSHELBY23_8 [Microbacterium phage Gshelby23]